jgi:chaperonin cofactor prefoldin
MTYIAKKDPASDEVAGWNKDYQKQGGSTDDFCRLFGWANYLRFYAEMEAWCSFIDALLPDWWPIDVIQGTLISVVKALHDNQAWVAYWKGLDFGNAAEKKIEQTITWAKDQINNAVADMRNRIDNEIIKPIRDRVERELKPGLDAAKTQIDAFQSKMGTFNDDLSKMKVDVTSMTTKVDAAAAKVQKVQDDLSEKTRQLDSKLENLQYDAADLDIKAKQLDNQFKDLDTRLHKALDDVDKRLKALEMSQPKGSGFEIPGLFKGA